MAIKFPSAIVMGIHPIAPTFVIDQDSLPTNIHFEIDDINQSLSAHYDQYDLIHVHMMKSSIKNMEYTMKELLKCLLPGGFIFVMDMDYDIYHVDAHKKVAMMRMDNSNDKDGVTAKGSLLARLFHGMLAICPFELTIQQSSTENRKVDEDRGTNVTYTTSFLDQDFMVSPLLDRNAVIGSSVYLPIGQWESCQCVEGHTQQLNHIGRLMHQYTWEMPEAFRKALLLNKVPTDRIGDGVQNGVSLFTNLCVELTFEQ
jgi:hypothetical protein